MSRYTLEETLGGLETEVIDGKRPEDPVGYNRSWHPYSASPMCACEIRLVNDVEGWDGERLTHWNSFDESERFEFKGVDF